MKAKRVRTEADPESPGCDEDRAGGGDYSMGILKVAECGAEVRAI